MDQKYLLGILKQKCGQMSIFDNMIMKKCKYFFWIIFFLRFWIR